MSGSTSPGTASDANAAESVASPQPPRRGPLLVIGLVATLLVAGGWLLPLWQAKLLAPQYPGGLAMQAYGHKVTGDVAEIDSLNHYVGMRAFNPEDLPETRLWPAALALAVAAVVIGLLPRRGLVGRLARMYLWLLPVGALAMIQLRLHQYGTDLDPGAALRLNPFTPWVVGPTRVWNFTTWAMPGLGLVALLTAAVVVSFGPRLVMRRRRRPGASAATAVLVTAALLAAMSPAGAAEGHDVHDHGGSVQTPTPTPGLDPTVTDRHPPTSEAGPATGDLAGLVAGVGSGGRLVLPPGSYHGSVVIDEPITIEGRDLPVLVGGGHGTVITVRAAGTVIRGVAVRGSGAGPTGNPAGIRIEADDVTIEDVVVEDSYVGIAVVGAERVRLVGNTIRGRASATLVEDGHAVDGASAAPHEQPAATGGRGDGIWLHDAVHVLIRGNAIEGTRDGVYISFGSDTLVDGNHVHRTRYAVHSMFAEHLTLAENHLSDNLSGMILMYGGPVLLLRNHVETSTSLSTGFALLLKDVVGVEAVENVLFDNRVGIHLDGPAGVDTQHAFFANTLAGNAIGVSAHSSARAAFRANSFADNLVQVLPQGGALDGIVWADRGWGNYWSSYRGYDANGTGRGVLPHIEGGAVDRLLLRNPELVAIADSPGIRLLRAVEERWGRRDQVLVDELPLTQPVSPALPVRPAARGATIAALAGGVALALPALLLWIPRRRSPASRRHPRVVPV